MCKNEKSNNIPFPTVPFRSRTYNTAILIYADNVIEMSLEMWPD